MNKIMNRIMTQIGDTEVLDKLLSLSGADLNSFLLELYSQRTSLLSPQDVLKNYYANRFTVFSEIDPVRFHHFEAELLNDAENLNINTILLSPVAIQGSCSAFGFVDQYNVISGVRGTETMSDPSNMLAIIMANMIKNGKPNNEPLHYATTARVARSQPVAGKGFFAHFGLFCMVSSGKDSGSYVCECDLLEKHLLYYHQLFAKYPQAKLSIVLRKRSGYQDGDGFFRIMTGVIHKVLPTAGLTFDYDDIDNGYYQGINFKIHMEIGEDKFELGEGGFVDWINQMLGSKKERCLISGMGIDRLLLLSKNEQASHCFTSND